MGTNQPQVSVCVMFSLDVNTNAVLASISYDLCREYPKLFVPSVLSGSMPYHMTMIGGIKLLPSEYKNTLRELVEKLKPFRRDGPHPKPVKVEPRQKNGNVLAVRFRLVECSYVLTGDVEQNQKLISLISPGFKLDDDRHVTVGAVPGTFSDLDVVSPTFDRLVYEKAEALLQATFTPQVWVKHDRVWTQFQL